MKRIAFLIGCINSKHGNLPGAEADLRNYRDFLMSPCGGAWNQDEIVTLRDPAKATLEATLARYSYGADYSLITFSGHGDEDPRMGSMIAVDDDDDITLTQLRTRALRQLVISDACRTLRTSIQEERVIKLGADLGGVPDYQYARSCRELYDRAIALAEQGVTVMKSCSPDQAARDSAHGGVFSYTLVRMAEGWAAEAGMARTASGMLDVPTIFTKVQAAVKQRYFPQTPELAPERRRIWFPFVVR